MALSTKQTPHHNTKTLNTQTVSHDVEHATLQEHYLGVVQKARFAPNELSLNDISLLQRTIGNRAVGKLSEVISQKKKPSNNANLTKPQVPQTNMTQHMIQRYALQDDPSFVSAPYPQGASVNAASGTSAHDAVQDHFKSVRQPPLGIIEFPMPGASARSLASGHPTIQDSQTGALGERALRDRRGRRRGLGQRLGDGKADLALRIPNTGVKIAEIKPARDFHQGDLTVDHYISHMRAQDPIARQWRRENNLNARWIGRMNEGQYHPSEYFRTESGTPIQVKWVKEGVIGWRPIGRSDSVYLCGIDDNGRLNTLIEKGVIVARAELQNRFEPIRIRAHQQLEQLTEAKIREIVGPPYADIIMQKLGPHGIVRLRRTSARFVDRLFNKFQQLVLTNTRKFLQMRLNVACAMGTVYTAEMIAQMIRENLNEIIEVSLLELALVATTITALSIVATVALMAAFYFLVEAALVVLAELAVISFTEIWVTFVTVTLARLAQLISQYGWRTLIPHFGL